MSGANGGANGPVLYASVSFAFYPLWADASARRRPRFPHQKPAAYSPFIASCAAVRHPPNRDNVVVVVVIIVIIIVVFVVIIVVIDSSFSHFTLFLSLFSANEQTSGVTSTGPQQPPSSNHIDSSPKDNVAKETLNHLSANHESGKEAEPRSSQTASPRSLYIYTFFLYMRAL